MKILISFLVLIFLGCSSKEYIFIPTNAKCIKKTNSFIGIEEVSLPYYMNDFEIMKLKDNKLIPTHKYLSKEPTQIIIDKLSNRLCDPNIFLYPWNRASYKISIKIDDLFFTNNKVFAYIRIYINSKYYKLVINKKCKKDINCINEVFNEIVNKIIKEIK